MLKEVKSYLKEQEWEFSKNEDSNVFMFGLGGENGNFQCVIDIEDKYITVYTFVGSNCPKKKRKGMFQLLNFINYQVFLGNFEMDQEDGEIRYRTSAYFDQFKPTVGFVGSLIVPNFSVMDELNPIIMSFMHGGLNLKDAMQSVKDRRTSQTP